jgi:hypothetical protein
MSHPACCYCSQVLVANNVACSPKRITNIQVKTFKFYTKEKMKPILALLYGRNQKMKNVVDLELN